jgi:ornithine--oxo-acid transaminase
MATEALMARGVLCKETHSTTVRIAPPLVITRDELDYGIDALTDVLTH